MSFACFYWCCGEADIKLPFARCVEASRYAIFELRLPRCGGHVCKNSSDRKASSHAVRCHQKLIFLARSRRIHCSRKYIIVFYSKLARLARSRGKKEGIRVSTG